LANARRSRLGLAAAAAVVAGCFGASLVLAGVALGRIHQEARVAAANAQPSTERLSQARVHLRELDGAMDAALLRTMRGQRADGAQVAAPRRALEGELDAYQRLPQYPGETARYEDVTRSLKALDDASATLLSVMAAGDLARAHELENGEWRSSSDRLDQSLQRLLLFNGARLRDHLAYLERSTRRTVGGLLLGGLLSVIVTLLAVRLTIKTVRERERILEARADEWEAFSARVAHGLMSPLQAVAFTVNLASERCHDEQVAKVSARGQSALGRMRATVDALFDFARAGGRPAATDRAKVRDVVSALLEELAPLAAEERVELTAGSLPDGEVACSPGTLYVVLSNLVQNAIKHMGERSERRVRLEVSTGGRRARFEVHDTGPGLDSQLEAEVFKPYVRGALPGVAGLGLGLATVKRIANSCGGAVGVRSRRGHGSVFWVELPSARPATAVAATSEPDARPAPDR
jgi:signal transduction histidine kinase